MPKAVSAGFLSHSVYSPGTVLPFVLGKNVWLFGTWVNDHLLNKESVRAYCCRAARRPCAAGMIYWCRHNVRLPNDLDQQLQGAGPSQQRDRL